MSGSQHRAAAGNAEGYRQRGRRRHLDGFQGSEWRRHQRAPARRGRRFSTRRARLNYRPHALARNLRTRRTGALGILLPDLTNPVYAATIRGAVRRAETLGYVMLVAEVPDDAASASVYSKLVASAASTASSSRSPRKQGPDRRDRHASGAACLRQPARHHRPQRHRRRRSRGRARRTHADRGRPHPARLHRRFRRDGHGASPPRWLFRGGKSSRAAAGHRRCRTLFAKRRLRRLSQAAQGASRGRPASSRPTCWSGSARWRLRARAASACRRICRS